MLINDIRIQCEIEAAVYSAKDIYKCITRVNTKSSALALAN